MDRKRVGINHYCTT